MTACCGCDLLTPMDEVLIPGDPPRATAFIVTLYGDVVLPRGGVLGMRSLIAVCGLQGLSESLVRTAVSRLVAAGQLEGARVGRRSFYRLTSAAVAEYAQAAQMFYAPAALPTGWRLALGGEGALGPGWVRLSGEVAMAPDGLAGAPPGAVVMSAQRVENSAALPGFAARHWPVAEASEAYAAVLALCAEISRQQDRALCDPGRALALRLRLIHVYRRAALLDPRLPQVAYPAHWPGIAARAAFVQAYLALTAPAEAHIAASLEAEQGRLPAQSDDTRARQACLLAESALI